METRVLRLGVETPELWGFYCSNTKQLLSSIPLCQFFVVRIPSSIQNRNLTLKRSWAFELTAFTSKRSPLVSLEGEFDWPNFDVWRIQAFPCVSANLGKIMNANSISRIKKLKANVKEGPPKRSGQIEQNSGDWLFFFLPSFHLLLRLTLQDLKFTIHQDGSFHRVHGHWPSSSNRAWANSKALQDENLCSERDCCQISFLVFR